MSPQSSRTLRRHHEESAKTSPLNLSEDDEHDDKDVGSSSRGDTELVPFKYRSSLGGDASSTRPRRRRYTDPSSDRPLVSHARQRDRSLRRDSASDDEEDVVEYLPDRFDSRGRPLDGSGLSRGHSLPPGMHSRRGDFEYRSPRGPDGLHMRGQWGVMGTDSEAVERIVKNVTGVLEGKQSWLGLVGGLLSGNLLKGIGDEDQDRGGRGRGSRGGVVSDDEEYYNSRRTGREDRKERKGKERVGDYDRDDDDVGYVSGRRIRERGEDERGESSRQGAEGSQGYGVKGRRRRWRGGDDYYDDHDNSDFYDYDDDSSGGWRKGRKDVRRARTWDVSGSERIRDGDGPRRRRDWDDD